MSSILITGSNFPYVRYVPGELSLITALTSVRVAPSRLVRRLNGIIASRPPSAGVPS
jgi:hypothetical protein